MMLSAGSTFFLLVSQLHQSDAYIVQPSPLNRKLNEINSFNERITINNQASDPKNINGHDEIGEQVNAVSSKSDYFNQDYESLPPRFKNDISSLKMRLSQIEKQREKALEHINDDMKHFVSFEDTDSEIAYLKGEILRKEEETQEIILKMEQDMMNQNSVLTEKIGNVSSELQNYKEETRNKQISNDLALQEREHIILKVKNENNILQTKLEEEMDESRLAKERSESFLLQKMEIEKEIKELRCQYVDEIMDVEDKFEQEQDFRMKERTESLDEIARLKLDAKAQVHEARQDGILAAESIRTDLTERLDDNLALYKDVMGDLSITKSELLSKEKYVVELETERKSVRKMVRVSWNLTKGRVKNIFLKKNEN